MPHFVSACPALERTAPVSVRCKKVTCSESQCPPSPGAKVIEDLLPGWTALAQELGAVVYESGTVKTVSAGLFTSVHIRYQVTARWKAFITYLSGGLSLCSHHRTSEVTSLHFGKPSSLLIWWPVPILGAQNSFYALCIWRGSYNCCWDPQSQLSLQPR